MGYYCPICQEEERKKNPYKRPDRRPALYERDPKGFHYAGYINCPEHGVQPGRPMDGTMTIISKNQEISSQVVMIVKPDGNDKILRSSETWELPEDLQDLIARELASGAEHSHKDPNNWQHSIILKDGHGDYEIITCKICGAQYKRRPWAWQPPKAPQKKAERIRTTGPIKNAAQTSVGPATTTKAPMHNQDPITKFKLADPSEETNMPIKLNIMYNIDAEPLISKKQSQSKVTIDHEKKSLAYRAALQHKLAKAGAGRIYHITVKDGQEFFKGSTGAIYHYAIVARQPGQNWRSYAWTETSQQAEAEWEKMKDRSVKQKLDLEILILDVVNEKEA